MKILYLLGIFLFTSFTQYAQNPEWITYTQDQYVYSICMEKDYVWMGTSGGLIRIDKATGSKTKFSPSNSGLPYNNVYAIVIDKSGNKWFGTNGDSNPKHGTYGALVKFDGVNWTVYNTPYSNFYSNYVTSIAIDKNDNKWVGTSAGGIANFDGANWTVYDSSNSSLPSNGVTSIVIDDSGTVWAGLHPDFYFGPNRGGGLAKFDGTNWTIFTISNSGLISNYITSIVIDNSGAKWIGTMRDYVANSKMTSGLVKFDGTNWTLYNGSNSGLPDNNVTTIAIDKNDNKWIGTLNQGLSKFNGTKWTAYKAINYGIPSNYLTSIDIDETECIWIGTEQGSAKFDGINWLNYVIGLPNNWIFDIALDAGNNKWIATFNGLAKFDGTKWTVYNSSNSPITDNRISCTAIDDKGNNWIGTEGGELLKFDGNKWTRWTEYKTSTESGGLGAIHKIFIDSKGNKWIGARAGVFKFDGINWTHWYPFGMSTSNDISSIAVDNDGNIWAGAGEGNGIAKFDGKNWTVYTTLNSGLPSGFTKAIVIDKNKNVWIATVEVDEAAFFGHGNGGLAKFDGTNWTVYNKSNSGLPINDIQTIEIDSSGNKWIGMWYFGLAKFDDVNWTVYNHSNSGLPENNPEAIAFDGLGNKWIGTVGGLAVYKEGGVVPVKDNRNDVTPGNFVIYQNFPNPFNPSTIIKYELPKEALVTIKLYDLLGHEIKTLVNEDKSAGIYSFSFNASNLADGVYFYRIEAGGYSQTKKMVLLK